MLSRPGGWIDSAENLGAFELKGALSIINTFGPIYLPGHYLLRICFKVDDHLPFT